MAIVFLTSSPTGPLDGSRPVEGLDKMNGFEKELKKVWVKNARCLMIAANPSGHVMNDEMTSFFKHALEISELSSVSFALWDDRTPKEDMESLEAYDVVFLGGGHVPTQNKFFYRIGLREKLRSFKGLVIGISAGTMNSADIVYAQPELPGEASDPSYKKFLVGLNLTKTMILPHYQMVKDHLLDGRRLFEDITCRDSRGKKFLALCDGSYLVCRHEQEILYGEAYLIQDGRIEQICSEDQHMVYRRK